MRASSFAHPCRRRLLLHSGDLRVSMPAPSFTASPCQGPSLTTSAYPGRCLTRIEQARSFLPAQAYQGALILMMSNHSNSANELLLRRKLEEQQQAIELQIELPSHGISAARPQSSSREQLKLSSGFALDGKVNAGDKEEFGGEASPYNSDSEHRLPRCCGLWQQHRQWSNSF
ncbi:hypothetical protein U9M48_044016 [Paspalum notatum var. saurae]|uniref:Uncharacterized protein n=1 Tax=Paspalum notatum var. saurae TaxID=547442 RepID=A0AAQ3UYQ0_PASNO